MQFVRSPGKSGSHFNPNSSLFQPNEKTDIITSTASWLAMVGVLAGLTRVIGPMQMLKLYSIPYLVMLTRLLLQAHLMQNKNLD
jgi:acyl-lipid omega-3 desaturase